MDGGKKWTDIEREGSRTMTDKGETKKEPQRRKKIDAYREKSTRELPSQRPTKINLSLTSLKHKKQIDE